ncbi:MAG: hypothetical protein K1X88_12555 [Nannocystaceae bacterium]|nr:hypothetical protein [Nannocystaceae bacterium]
MLDAARAPALHRGVVVFFDHVDADVVYAAAQVPRLLADPTPQLSLVRFRGSGSGGSLLSLQLALAPSPAQLDALAHERLREDAAGPPRILRPSWRAGNVRVFGFLDDPTLPPRVLAVGPPSLLGDPSVVLAARLDEQATAIAEASLRGDSLPTVVAFELEALALGGPLGIEIEADLQAIHDRLTVGGALTTPYAAAKLKATWEEFARERLIRVNILDESGELESNRSEALRRVGESLIAEMLTSEPPPEAPPVLDDKPVAPIELSFRLTVRRESLATTKSWRFHERAAVPLRFAAAASLIDLLRGEPIDAHIRDADLGTDTRAVLVRAEPELGALGLAALEVDVRVASRDALQSVVLTDTAPEARVVLERDGFEPLAVRTRARFDPTLTAAADRSSEWTVVEGSAVVLSARRLFPPRSLTFIVGRAELDWIDAVEIAVDTPPQPTRTLRLSASQRWGELLLLGADEGPPSYRVRWRGDPDEPSVALPAAPVTDDVTLLDSPFGPSMHVLCVPLPASDRATLTLELRAGSGELEQLRSLAWDGDDRQPRRASLRRLIDAPRSYEYRTTAVGLDGRIETSPWQRSETAALVLGGDGYVVASCDVFALGGPAGRGSVAIALTLQAGEHATHVVLEGTQDHAALVLAHPPDAGAPVLTLDEFLQDGTVRTRTVAPIPAMFVLDPAPPTDAPR